MAMPRKSETLTFRIDATTLETIQRAARMKGKSVTAFVTEVAQAAAERDLLDQRLFQIDARAFDEIDAMLNAPAKLDDRLVKLFRSEREWID